MINYFVKTPTQHNIKSTLTVGGMDTTMTLDTPPIPLELRLGYKTSRNRAGPSSAQTGTETLFYFIDETS